MNVGSSFPHDPDAKALDEFLMKEKKTDPLRFPDLSLSIIKLMGAGEYIAELPGDTSPGHFGLAVRDYTHATAPNRRYIDLITERLLKGSHRRKTLPYSNNELEVLAKALHRGRRCCQQSGTTGQQIGRGNSVRSKDW